MPRIVKSFLVLSLFIVLIVPQFTIAYGGDNTSNNSEASSEDVSEPKNENEIETKREEIKNRAEQRLEDRKGRIASKAAERQEKLEARKQKICENRSEKIKNRSERLANRAEKQLKNFTSIAERVDKFYLNRLVPKGVTVSNYDSLKADIEARKQEVKNAIEAAKAAVTGFDCSGDNPKGQLGTYRVEMKDAIAALKDFRISIKNFIVAIRTAAKANNATGSAESGK